MAGSTPFAPSSVSLVSGLLKDRVVGKGHQHPTSNNGSSNSRLLCKKMASHKLGGEQPAMPIISRKSSVFTIENLLAPSTKSPAPSQAVSRTSPDPTLSPTSVAPHPAAFNASDMAQQQLQYHHHQNLFSVVGHHHQHHHIMPLALTDPAAYGYTYLGMKSISTYVQKLPSTYVI